jgi:hypothetical protein
MDETITGISLNIKIGIPEHSTENVPWYPGYRIFAGDSKQWFLNSGNVEGYR